jgi:hypothetical protein
MRDGLKLSIGALMGFIALLALELALFQRLLFLIMMPPITMALISLNLAVLYAFRWLPRALSSRIGGLLSGGLISIFVLVGYYVITAAAPNINLGIVGRELGAYFNNLAASRSDPAGALATALRGVAQWAHMAEFILLDLVGLSIIWFGGWLDARSYVSAAAPEARAS